MTVNLSTTNNENITGGGDGAQVIVIANPVLSKSRRTFDHYFNPNVFALPAIGQIDTVDPGHRTRLPSSLFSALWSPPESGVECLVTTGAEGARPRTCKGSGRQAEKA